MFKYLVAMIIPIGVFCYTVSFARWLGRKKLPISGPAYVIGAGSLGISGVVLWRMLL